MELIARAHEGLDSRIAATVAQWLILPLSVEIFGSVASGRSTLASDIDLLIAAPALEVEQEATWAGQVHALQEQVERWTGNDCEVLELTPADLAELRDSGGRVLEGPRETIAGSPIDELLRVGEAGRRFRRG